MTVATSGRFESDSWKVGGRARSSRGRHALRRRLSAISALALVLGLGLQMGMMQPASAAPAPVGNGFVVTTGDLSFILKQIKIAERHTTTLTASDPCGTMVNHPGDGIPDAEQVPDYLTAYGLRLVDGSCNNLKDAGTANFAAANQTFPRLTRPSFQDAETVQGGPETGPPSPRSNFLAPGQCDANAPCPTSYKQAHGNVVDSEPRVVSNLIVDQTSTNPAALAAARFPVRTQSPGEASAVPCTTDPDPGNPPVLPPTIADPPGCTPSHHTLFIPNVTTDVGLSPPYNSIFTFFGQFFDHGVDQTVKTGDTVFVPLKADDPLRTLGPDGIAGTNCGTATAKHCDEVPASQAFMVLTRAQVKAGPDGVLGDQSPTTHPNQACTSANVPAGCNEGLDDGPDNTDTPWVDQSQTYTSHASHQVFLREYVGGAGTPGPNNAAAVATGKLLTGLPAGQTFDNSPSGVGGESTWASVKQQSAQLLGLRLKDIDVVDIPMLQVDPYGKYLPGPHGLPQYVCNGVCKINGIDQGTGNTLEGNLLTPVPVPDNAVHFETPFVGDIAHNADPSAKFDSNGDHIPDALPTPDKDGQPCGAAQTDPTVADLVHTANADFASQCNGTYDDELLNAHASCGDGRCNENIALTSIHQVFHSEHNRLVDYIKNVLESDTSAQGVAALAQWKATGVAGAGGTGSYGYGERLFQAARYVTEMEYQHLVFEEFARKVQPAVRPFHVYSPDINPAIEAEFAHAVYRFGHSMLDDDVARTNVNPTTGAKADNSVPLLTAFLNPPELFNGGAAGTLTAAQGAGSVFMGSADQTGNEIDEFVTETLRNNLLGLPLDLPTINMTRAREAGVAPLNEVRREIFADTNDGQLAPYTSWSDYGQHLKHPESLINFVAAYGTHPSITSATTLVAKRDAARAIVDPRPAVLAADGVTVVTPADVPPADAGDFMFSTGTWASQPNGVTTTGLDDVDLWVGGLAEVTNLFGGLLGTTFNYVFQTQLEKLQDGDRLYYLARTPGMNLRTQLEGNSFSEMIQRNTEGTNSMKADAFATSDCKFQVPGIHAYTTGAPTATHTADPTIPILTGAGAVDDDPATTDCDENQLLLLKPDGTVQYRLINKIDPSGINGQSVYNGGPGVDRIFGGNDNDTFWGGGSGDIIEGGGGDDIALGGDGDDIITDLGGADTPKGGPGNDAIDAGIGDDIPMGNEGKDFINGGANDNESFAGPGDDFVIAGQGADAVFGDGGDDWIQGGTGQDLLQGDHGAPFFDDPAETAPGNDIFIGQPGENDYDTEGGDDIMAQNAAIDRNAGAGGFDWAIHQYDTVGGNDDLEINQQLAGLPLPIVVNRDRWQETEADSGSNFNDVIRGDALERIVGGFGFSGCDALDQAGVDRITGLGDYVTTFPTSAADVAAVSPFGSCPLTGVSGAALNGSPGVWAEGNILFGGGGSDLIEGRENEDIIDGDNALHVQIDVHANIDGTGPVIASYDQMEGALQQAVFAGQYNPGQLVASRFIVKPDNSPIGTSAVNTDATGNPVVGVCPAATADSPVNGVTGHTVKVTAADTNCDTAVFSTALSVAGVPNYRIDPGPVTGSINVVDLASEAGIAGGDPFPGGDGIDTLYNVENLRFCVDNDPVTKLCDAWDDFSPAAAAALVNPVAAPLNVTALALNGAALVTWSEPAGSDVASFDVKAIDGSGTEVKKVTVPGAARSATITGLTNGTTLTFRVRANGQGGGGTDSAPSAPVTPQAPQILAPGAPSIGSATAAVGGASVSWSAPASDGGASIQSYKVEVLNSSNAVLQTVTVNAPATSTLVSGLAAGTVVRLRVSATNSAGTGSASSMSNAVTVIGDLVAPTVSNRTPASAATNVPTGTLVTATFSEPVQGVSGTTFKLTNTTTGTAVSATVTVNSAGTSVTLTPSAALANGTQYSATLTGGASSIRDTAGNAMSTTTWSFRTAADVTAPTATSRTPGPGATHVALNAKVVVVFSEPVKGVSGTSFTLTNLTSGKQIKAAVTLSANGKTATLNPSSNLANARQFRVSMTNGIKDMANNRLAAISWKFNT